ncbi:MAG TPA: ParB N-terminal domain-containing protein [Candidatus Limnocylindrales bacterium]|nr:ParB N-terminal domain-containing protein [Candidatus Limnocylindrales bacterium]
MTMPAADAWRNRIVGTGEVAPEQLVPNPANWRTHPTDQQQALSGALSEVGWVAQVLVNQTTGHVVDGHLRVKLAISRGEPSVPVLYVELTEAEERLVLASLDPIGAMAEAETLALGELLGNLESVDGELRSLLDRLAAEHGIQTLHEGLVDPDEVTALPAEPTVKPGELYALGDHRLVCGDSRSRAGEASLR